MTESGSSPSFELGLRIMEGCPTIPELARLLFMRAFRGSNPKTNRITFT
jgi:hypothetical protein